MSELKIILMGLGLAFGLAIGAWIFARIVRAPIERSAEEMKMPVEQLRLLYPDWFYWLQFSVLGVFLLVDFYSPGTMDLWFSRLNILVAIGVFLLVGGVWDTHLIRREAKGSPFRVIVARRLRSGIVWLVIFTSYIAWLFWKSRS